MSVIGYNSAAVNAAYYLNQNTANLNSAIQELSSGSRIANPATDAAGTAVSGQMVAAIDQLSAATQGAQDVVSFAQTTDGFLSTIQQELPRMAVKNEDIYAAIMREHERGLRTVDDEARGALRRAGLEEGGKQVVAPGADRKDGADRDIVFEIGRSVERIECDAKRRFGIQGFRQRRFLGENRSDGRIPQCAPHHFVGDNVDILLLIAVGIDAAILASEARERPVGDQRGQIDGSSGNGLDHLTHRSPVRRQRHRPTEM